MTLILIEVWSYVQIPVIWYLFKKLARRDVSGHMIAGTLIGAFLEFSTEPLWQYHFKITVYKHNTPLSVVTGWGVMFTLVVFLSEKLYCWFLKESTILPQDKRILFFDALGALLIGLPLETLGLKSGVWDYRNDILHWDWGIMPFFRMPYEALFGYTLLMLIAPTFVRYWEGVFSPVGSLFKGLILLEETEDQLSGSVAPSTSDAGDPSPLLP